MSCAGSPGVTHIAEGAVAVVAAAGTGTVAGSTDNEDEQLRLSCCGCVSKADQSEAAAERVELGSMESGKAIAGEMGLKPSAPCRAFA